MGAYPDALRPYAPGVWDPDADPAELYYLPDDFTQVNDLAASHPEKVAELRELFWAEAEKYKVLPLLATLSAFFGILPPMPDAVPVEYRGDVQNIMQRAAENRRKPYITLHSRTGCHRLAGPGSRRTSGRSARQQSRDRRVPARPMSRPGPAFSSRRGDATASRLR